MKDNILLFIIGVLVGAIISTSSFYIYTKTVNSNNCNNGIMQMPEGNIPDMPNNQSDKTEQKRQQEKPEENIQNRNDSQKNNQSNNN